MLFLSDETFYRFTTDAYEYYHWTGVVGKTYFLFEVQACSDAHLAMAAIPHNSQTVSYEIVIGANANGFSLIRLGRQLPDIVRKSTPGILDCGSSRAFWVSWRSGRIAVGRGSSVGSDQFMELNVNKSHSVNNIGVSTGFGSNGTWKIESGVFGTILCAFPLK